MSHSRRLCIGIGKSCLFTNSVHMHTIINGIPVVLKLAEFDSSFKISKERYKTEGYKTKNASHEKIQNKISNKTCCPECKCGVGEAPSSHSLKPMKKKKKKKEKKTAPPICNRSAASIKCKDLASICSTKKMRKQKPKKEKPCKKRRSYCVFVRKEPKPKKISEPRKAKKPKVKRKVKYIESCPTYSTETIRPAIPTIRSQSSLSKKQLICCPSDKPPPKIKSPSKELIRCPSDKPPQKTRSPKKEATCCPPDKPPPKIKRSTKKEAICCPPNKPLPKIKRPPKKEVVRCPSDKPPPKTKSRSKECCLLELFKPKRKKQMLPRRSLSKESILKKTKRPTCRPVFVDKGTCTKKTGKLHPDIVKHQYNVEQNEKTGFETENKVEPSISGDTDKTIYSNSEKLYTSVEASSENSKAESDEVKYRFIACHLKQGMPESNTPSKSASEVQDCLGTTVSVYAPSISSITPSPFDKSDEILSTIVDHANSNTVNTMKDEKGTDTTSLPGVAYSTSTSAQTCLIDYELFKGITAHKKIVQKDFVLQETLIAEKLSGKSDSYSSTT